MRGKILLAVTLLGLTGLSGCLGFGEETSDDDHGDHCEGLEGDAHDECHDDPDPTHNDGNDTNSTPNAPPVAMLTMTDPDGNVLTNGSAIRAGQNVTFSANGSADPDGDLELVALTVLDKNGSRTVSLLQGGQLVDATMLFETNGFMVATLRVLDNDGDAAAASDYAWVNIVQVKEGSLDVIAPSAGVGDCEGPGGGEPLGSPIIDQPYSASEGFGAFNGTRWISAKATGDVVITICDPEGNKISEGGAAEEVSTPEGDYPARVDYSVFVKATGPGAEYTIEIISHWEPKPAS